MAGATRGVLTRSVDYVHERVRRWRTGSRESQLYVLCLLLAGVAVSFVVSWNSYRWMPLTAYFVWLLAGMLVLRFKPLALLAVVASTAAIVAIRHDGPIDGARITAVFTLALSVALILYQASRQRSGLPVTLSEAMLAELRDRLQAQGVMPALPHGWEAQSAMLSSHGVGYAGDFFVADLVDDKRLEMVLVDVCGKGVAVGPQSLQFAGALGGLLGALPPRELFDAANKFLLRQHSDESFATAVHVVMDLEDGRYTITSAGHPPAFAGTPDRPSGWSTTPAGWRSGSCPTPSCTTARACCRRTGRSSSTPTASSSPARPTSTSGSPGSSARRARRWPAASRARPAGSSSRYAAATTTARCSS